MSNNRIMHLIKWPELRLSEKSRAIIFNIITYLFVGLFVYTAAGKLMTIDTLKHVLIKYPLIGQYPITIAYLVPFTEIFVSLALIIPVTKRYGMFASFVLMTLFFIYILYMLLSGSQLPCSCGGIISKLSWQQHIWFDLILIGLAFLGLKIHKK